MRVSVCIPTRNQGRFLDEAVRSALTQDVEDMEVVVHDDASDDDTPRVLAAIRDSRLRVHRHTHPLGIAANRNSCVESARGEAVAWLDSDDAYLPGTLARRLEVLDRHPRVGLVHGGFQVIDAAGRQLRPWPALHEEDRREPGADAFRDLAAGNTITTSTVVVRASVQREAGPFATSIGAGSSDWDMWLRIALRADLAYLAEPLARYRQHEHSISVRMARSGERLRCDRRVVEHVLQRDAGLVVNRARARRSARAALAARALRQAGDHHTAGRRGDALRAVAFAGRMAPAATATGAPALMLAIVRGDDYRGYRQTRRMLAVLAERLESPRHATRLARSVAEDPDYEQMTARAAAKLRRLTPRRAVVASVTKWDPTMLWLSRRRGVQFPDRRRMPDGYPGGDEHAISHLAQLQADGATHLAFTAATRWWLDYYPAFAAHLHERHTLLLDDADCVVYALA